MQCAQKYYMFEIFLTRNIIRSNENDSKFRSISFFFYANVFSAGQAEVCEGFGQAVLGDGGADDVALRLEGLAAVGHADAGADGADHLDVIHAVAEADGVLHGNAEVLADAQDAAALVKSPVDELAVEAGVVGVADLLDDKLEVLFQEVARGLELLVSHAHDDDLVDRGGPVIFRQRFDVQALGQGFAPALDLAVALLPGIALEEGTEIFVAVGGVQGLHRAEDAFTVQGGQGSLRLVLRHGAVVDDLVSHRHIAAGTGDDAVKAEAEQGGEHGEVPAGAEKDLVPRCLRLPDGLQSALRRVVGAGLRECAVNIQKDQFLSHKICVSFLF